MALLLQALLLQGLLTTRLLAQEETKAETQREKPQSQMFAWSPIDPKHLQKIPRLPKGLPKSRALMPNETHINGYWDIISEALDLPSDGKNGTIPKRTMVESFPGFHPLKTLLPNTSKVIDFTKGSAQQREREHRANASIRGKQKLQQRTGRRRVFREWPIFGRRKRQNSLAYHPTGLRVQTPSYIPLGDNHPEGRDEYENFVYYTMNADPQRPGKEHHLAIVEVPKGAKGKIPLNNVHVIAPGLSSKASQSKGEFRSFLPSSPKSPISAPPYMIMGENERDKEDPYLVIPFSEKHAKQHGVSNVVLPLQRAPQEVSHLKESFKQLRSASLKEASHIPGRGFGPPKYEDVVSKASRATSKPPFPSTKQPHRHWNILNPQNQREIFRRPPKSKIIDYGPPKSHSIMTPEEHGRGTKKVEYVKLKKTPSPYFSPQVRVAPKTTTQPPKPPPPPQKRIQWPNVGTNPLSTLKGAGSNNVEISVLPPNDWKRGTTPIPRRFPFNVIERSRQRLSKSIQEIPIWLDGVFGAESKHQGSVRKTPLRMKNTGKHHSKHPKFPANHKVATSLNENSIFLSKLPHLEHPFREKGPNYKYKMSPALIRDSNLVQISPIVKNSPYVATLQTSPNSFVRADAQLPPKYYVQTGALLHVPTIKDYNKPIPPPSHRGSPAVGFNGLSGPLLSIKAPVKLQTSFSNPVHTLSKVDPSNYQAKVPTLRENKEYSGPQLVMFTLDDAIPMVPAYQTSSELSVQIPDSDMMPSETSRSHVPVRPSTVQDRQPKNKYYMIQARRNSTKERAHNIFAKSKYQPIQASLVSPEKFLESEKIPQPTYDELSEEEAKASLSLYDKLPPGKEFQVSPETPATNQTSSFGTNYFQQWKPIESRINSSFSTQITSANRQKTKTIQKNSFKPAFSAFTQPRDTTSERRSRPNPFQKFHGKQDTQNRRPTTKSKFPNFLNYTAAFRRQKTNSKPITQNTKAIPTSQLQESLEYEESKKENVTTEMADNNEIRNNVPSPSSGTEPKITGNSFGGSRQQIRQFNSPKPYHLQRNNFRRVNPTSTPPPFSFNRPEVSQSKWPASFNKPTNDANNKVTFGGFSGFKNLNKQSTNYANRDQETKETKNRFGFKFFNTRGSERDERPTTNDKKANQRDFSSLLRDVWGVRKRENEDMQAAESTEDSSMHAYYPLSTEDQEGDYSEQHETTLKWPKYIRPPSLSDDAHSDLKKVIQNSVNEVIKQNSQENTNQQEIKRTDIKHLDSLDMKPKMTTSTTPSQSNESVKTPPLRNTSSYQKFRKFLNRRKTADNSQAPAKDDSKSEAINTEAINTTSFPTSTTTPEGTSLTTFKIEGQPSSKRRPFSFLSMLREKDKLERASTTKTPEILTTMTATQTTLNVSPSTKTPAQTTRTSSRRRNRFRPGKPSNYRSRKRVPNESRVKETNFEKEKSEDPTMSESKIVNAERKPVKDVFLQDIRAGVTLLNWDPPRMRKNFPSNPSGMEQETARDETRLIHPQIKTNKDTTVAENKEQEIKVPIPKFTFSWDKDKSESVDDSTKPQFSPPIWEKPTTFIDPIQPTTFFTKERNPQNSHYKISQNNVQQTNSYTNINVVR